MTWPELRGTSRKRFNLTTTANTQNSQTYFPPFQTSVFDSFATTLRQFFFNSDIFLQKTLPLKGRRSRVES